jgi:hypothetical protein
MKKKGDKKERKRVRKLAKKVDEEKAWVNQRKLREALIPIAYKYSDEPTSPMDVTKYDTVGEQIRHKMALRDRAKTAFKAKKRNK